MVEKIQQETLKRGSVLTEKDYFALDVDISLFLSGIWELIGLIRSKKVIGAYHVMS